MPVGSAFKVFALEREIFAPVGPILTHKRIVDPRPAPSAGQELFNLLIFYLSNTSMLASRRYECVELTVLLWIAALLIDGPKLEFSTILCVPDQIVIDGIGSCRCALFLTIIVTTPLSSPNTSSITALTRCTFSSPICTKMEPDSVSRSRATVSRSRRYVR